MTYTLTYTDHLNRLRTEVHSTKENAEDRELDLQDIGNCNNIVITENVDTTGE